ncbi:MAG: complex I NDUFA9 subunit family protein [Nitrospiraceae bacterium]|nr:complex I NDUFA9 subunit family protein [Nitrospiraceae bacterium]
MIFIAGASGFTGGHLVGHLIRKGFGVKALARSSASARKLSAEGCQVVQGDITDPSSLKGVLSAGDIVIHLVGIIEEKGDSTFQKVHVDGTANLVQEAKAAGVRHFFYQSALGADLRALTAYLRTKAGAEEIVRASGIPFTIFRPSLIIGPWDGFTKRMLEIIRLSPVIPVPGRGDARFQPLYIKDWLVCMQRLIEDPEAFQGTFEIGGPEHLTYREIILLLASASGHERPVVNLPMGLMKFAASAMRLFPSPPVTADQLKMLEQDNITDIDSIYGYFGFQPMRFGEALKEFVKE